MNSQEAKFILQAYRHNSEDADDPRIAEALAQAGRDAELAAWLAEDQKLHRLLSRCMKSIPVPPDLKASILAGGNVVRPAVWWRRPFWIGAAAAFLLLASVGGFRAWQGRPGDMATFREEMSRFLSTQFTYLDYQSEQTDDNLRWLAQYEAPADFVLPESLRHLPAIGCRILSWHGQSVSLICFRVKNGGAVHLFVVDRPRWKELPPRTAPNLVPSGLWMTASWSEGDKAFLLAGKGTESELRGYLNP